MSMLVNQFCEASREWAQKTNSSELEIPFWVMHFTGPLNFPRDADPSLDEMKEWLEKLAHEVRMDEVFLVVSLMQAIEKQLELESENIAKPIAQIRAFERLMETEEAGELSGLSDEQKEEFKQSIPRLKEKLQPSLEKMRDRKLRLDTWREVTSPILEPANLDKGREFWVQHLYPQEG